MQLIIKSTIGETSKTFTFDSALDVKCNPYRIFNTAALYMRCINTNNAVVNREYKTWCDIHLDGLPSAGAAAKLLLELIRSGNSISFAADDLSVEMQLVYSRSELVIFVDGVDGSGKSTVVSSFANRNDVCVTYELGSTPLGHLPTYCTKQLILSCRAQSRCPTRDFHYAFAERWHAWSNLIDTDKLVLSDRSWISTLVYQGIEAPNIITDIMAEGKRLTNYLYKNGKFPIYLLLTNDPYIMPSRDSLESMLVEKHIIYRMVAGLPVDDMTLAQYGVLNDYACIDYSVLPILGIHNTEITALIDLIME